LEAVLTAAVPNAIMPAVTGNNFVPAEEILSPTAVIFSPAAEIFCNAVEELTACSSSFF
jgi:hypothetical protein